MGSKEGLTDQAAPAPAPAPVQVIGTPFSTFTRTITLALHQLGVPFVQRVCLPHSDLANQHSPFGLLPALIHHRPASASLTLWESPAIARYIDVVFDGATHFRPPPSDVLGNVRTDQWINLASTSAFPILEHRVIKPRLAMEAEAEAADGDGDGDGGASEDHIRAKLAPALDDARRFLATLEAHRPLRDADYVLGDQPGWADWFLYSPLADFRAIPEGECVRTGGEFAWITHWLDRMEARDNVKKTFDGTLASQRPRHNM